MLIAQLEVVLGLGITIASVHANKQLLLTNICNILHQTSAFML